MFPEENISFTQGNQEPLFISKDLAVLTVTTLTFPEEKALSEKVYKPLRSESVSGTF